MDCPFPRPFGRGFLALGFSWLFIAIALWAVMIHIVPLVTDRGVSMMTAGILGGVIGATSIIEESAQVFFRIRWVEKES